MSSTTNKNTMLHRSSRRINRPALSVSAGRADFEKSATAHTHFLTHPYPPYNNPFQTPLPSCSLFPNSIPYKNTGNTAKSTFINNTKSSVKNQLTPNSNCLPQSVKSQPAQEKRRLREAPSPGQYWSIQHA